MASDAHSHPVSHCNNCSSNNNTTTTTNNNNNYNDNNCTTTTHSAPPPALPKLPPPHRRSSFTTNPVFQNILGHSPLLALSTAHPTPLAQIENSIPLDNHVSPAINYPLLADTFETRPRTVLRAHNTDSWLSGPTGTKLLMLEDVALRLLDTTSGIKLTNKSKFFQIYKNSFYGRALVDWLIPNCKLCNRSDAAKCAQSLLDHMFIISVDPQDQFKEESLFIFQTSFLWPTVPWTNLNIPYMCYLIKRSQGMPKTPQLTDTEKKGLERLMKKYKNAKSEVSRSLKEQKELCNFV
ncbi:Regulator of G-protein signaling 7 [Entophlyctis luteolus]|nr:Regulator of G-protein signaling 7 [Entophlyctis luteolus]